MNLATLSFRVITKIKNSGMCLSVMHTYIFLIVAVAVNSDIYIIHLLALLHQQLEVSFFIETLHSQDKNRQVNSNLTAFDIMKQPYALFYRIFSMNSNGCIFNYPQFKLAAHLIFFNR